MRLLLALLVAVSAHAATTLQVQVPSSSTTGVPFNFTVTARNGPAVDTAYNGTVHFTSSDPAAVLPSDYTFTPADAGKHTFPATMNTSGSGRTSAQRTITVTDTAAPAVNGTDDTTVFWSDIEVRWFFISAPDIVDRDVPFQIEVRAMNNSFEVVTSYTGTVHFTATRDEILPADYTFTPADAGRHGFTVTATRGNYSLFGVRDVDTPTVNGTVDSIDVVCPELVASATNSGPVCQGSQATLFGNANLPVIDYYWRSAQGSVGPPLWESHEQNPLVYPGTYILTVRQANECTATAQTTVTIHQPEVPQVTLSTEALCGPGNLQATLTNPGSFSNIAWAVDGGTIVSGQGTPTLEVAPNPGSGQIWLAIDANETSSGCSAYRFIDEVPVGSGVAAEISTVPAACPQETRTASVADAGSGATYAWSITNGAITSNGGTPTVQYVSHGSGDVVLAVTVTKGSCSATDMAVVPVDVPAAVVDDDVPVICGTSEATIEVTLSGTPPLRIVWSDGVVQENITTLTTARTVTNAGAYWITQVSDAHCSGTSSGAAQVGFGETPAIQKQPQAATTIRSGEAATLTVAATGGGLRYHWYEGRAGDRTHPVSSELDPSFTTPALTRTTSFWVEIENDCGRVESHAATVAVSNAGGRRRASHS